MPKELFVRPLEAPSLNSQDLLNIETALMSVGVIPNDEIARHLAEMKASLQGVNGREYLVTISQAGVLDIAIGVVGYKVPEDAMKAFARTDNPTELINMYVSQKSQGKGLGRRLVSALEELALKRGFKEIILNSGSRYKENWGFYDNLPKFERVGELQDYYGEGRHAPVWSKIL